MQQETATPKPTEKAKPALLAPYGEEGPRITYSVGWQYATVPLVYGCLALLPFLVPEQAARWVGTAGVALCVAWALVRLAWVERLTINFHSGRYRYRRGWWPIAPLKVGVLGEIQSVTLDRQDLSVIGAPVSFSDLARRYAQTWRACVWIVGLSFHEREGSLSVTNFFDRTTELAARAAAAELAEKLGIPLLDRTGGA